jgi:metal-sulfur cluster biosynthetic enzyme
MGMRHSLPEFAQIMIVHHDRNPARLPDVPDRPPGFPVISPAPSEPQLHTANAQKDSTVEEVGGGFRNRIHRPTIRRKARHKMWLQPSGDKTVASDVELLDALKQVIDPELMINIVDLGLVYDIDQDETGTVKVNMTLTSPSCPAGPQIIQQAKLALQQVPGVTGAEIRLVMSPPWTPERMTEEARDHLGIF